MKMDTSPPLNPTLSLSNQEPSSLFQCSHPHNAWSAPVMSVSTKTFASEKDPVVTDSLLRLRTPFDPVLHVSSREKMPLLRRSGSAGFALFANAAVVVPARGSATISSGISVQIPFGHYGKIEAVPFLGLRYDITPFGQIVDENCNNIIYVKLLNNSNVTYGVKKGDNIAQLIVQRYSTPILQYVREKSQHMGYRGGFGPIGGPTVFKQSI